MNKNISENIQTLQCTIIYSSNFIQNNFPNLNRAMQELINFKLNSYIGLDPTLNNTFNWYGIFSILRVSI